MTASCRSCGAAIEWVHTTQGRTMPIDGCRARGCPTLSGRRGQRLYPSPQEAFDAAWATDEIGPP